MTWEVRPCVSSSACPPSVPRLGVCRGARGAGGGAKQSTDGQAPNSMKGEKGHGELWGGGGVCWGQREIQGGGGVCCVELSPKFMSTWSP